MADLQRKYRSLERREYKIPKVPQRPDKVFYRILDGSEERSKEKKHVKFQMLGEEDEETRKKSLPFLERSPVPARYRAFFRRTRMRVVWMRRDTIHGAREQDM